MSRIIFTRDEILNIRDSTPSDLCPNFLASPVDLQDLLIQGPGLTVRRRKRGKRAGALVRFRKRGMRSPLPTQLTGFQLLRADRDPTLSGKSKGGGRGRCPRRNSAQPDPADHQRLPAPLLHRAQALPRAVRRHLPATPGAGGLLVYRGVRRLSAARGLWGDGAHPADNKQLFIIILKNICPLFFCCYVSCLMHQPHQANFLYVWIYLAIKIILILILI